MKAAPDNPEGWDLSPEAFAKMDRVFLGATVIIFVVIGLLIAFGR